MTPPNPDQPTRASGDAAASALTEASPVLVGNSSSVANASREGSNEPATASPWQPLASAPKDGSPFDVQRTVTYRWMPYKKASEQRRRGINGRWQMTGEYGGWDNCPAPPEGSMWRPVRRGPALAEQPLETMEGRHLAKDVLPHGETHPDTLSEFSADKLLRYRGYTIYFEPPPIPTRAHDWHYVHDDFDGAPDAGDPRCGHAANIEACMTEIDTLEDDA